MTALHQADRHSRLSDAAWNDATARETIRAIAQEALAAFDGEKFWPVHPLDSPGIDGMGGIYMGAAGIVLALDELKQAGVIQYALEFRPFLSAIEARDAWIRQTPFADYGSLLMGNLGPMLLAMRLAPSEDLADRIHARIAGNTVLPPLELMWGMAGSMLACDFMHERSKEARWRDLYCVQAQRLLGALETVGGHRLWVQNLYGQRMVSLGLVHGFAGNLLALIRGWDWLSEDVQAAVADVATSTLLATAQRLPGEANWPSDADQPDAPLLCQICHGAPGIVSALARAPFSTPALERLLHDAGTLIWRAGPLAKGSNFCHGTGGNAYSLLHLHKRTGERLWLERARAFAMEAIAQWRTARSEHGRGRYSLWTGDIGLALCLWACMTKEPAFPSLDRF